MSGKVWNTGLVVCMILQAASLIAVLIVGWDGLHDSPIMACVKISTVLTVVWLLASFGSFVAEYHPYFNPEQEDQDETETR